MRARERKREHLYYQELFKTEIILPGMKGDVELTFNIPANTKVTHLRIPGTNGNNQYDSVTVNGVTKMAPQDKTTIPLTCRGTTLGNRLLLRSMGYRQLKALREGRLNIRKTCCKFASVTNDNMAVGSTATFTLASAVNGTGSQLT